MWNFSFVPIMIHWFDFKCFRYAIQEERDGYSKGVEELVPGKYECKYKWNVTKTNFNQKYHKCWNWVELDQVQTTPGRSSLGQRKVKSRVWSVHWSPEPEPVTRETGDIVEHVSAVNIWRWRPVSDPTMMLHSSPPPLPHKTRSVFISFIFYNVIELNRVYETIVKFSLSGQCQCQSGTA